MDYSTTTKCIALSLVIALCVLTSCSTSEKSEDSRSRELINDGWKFFKYASSEDADALIYDVRPDVEDDEDGKDADAQPTEAEYVDKKAKVLKKWILPTGNSFLKNNSDHHKRPESEPYPEFSFLQSDFDETDWESVDLPHDWAIEGPFYEGANPEVGGGMGRLPSPGVGWYRKKIDFSKADLQKQIVLEVDGAMSYAMVWLNGKIVGGWPYGYASWQVDLSDYAVEGENQLAIRLDNPPASSRWYPGGGLYRNVWITKKNRIHIKQWGTFVTAENVSEDSADINLKVALDNTSEVDADLRVENRIYEINEDGTPGEKVVSEFDKIKVKLTANSSEELNQTLNLSNPNLWGPPPNQKPNQYLVKTLVFKDNQLIDDYETKFGLRSLEFDPYEGVHVNGEKVYIKGVNLHHDLGALGAAFYKDAARRQLEGLKEMGVNAIRMAHNQPDPKFLDLTDEMGFLVVNEIFDVWERKKTPLDFHLIFPDWYEQDLRAFVRRDRNHPSVVVWSYGNEVGEQYTGEEGAALSKKLSRIVKEEDTTRPTTVSMNFSKPDMPFSKVPDVINLNYQGEGIRNTPAHAHLDGIRTDPLYADFHEALPEKLVLSSENAAALSTRGEFLLPVQDGVSYPVTDGQGGDSKNKYVSDYGIYAVEFGSSPDKVFKAKDQHPFVGGGFVWSGWDYLGEPSPYYSARSSYFGIIDLAGFKKSRFYQYQARWRPSLKTAHIIPHWNWESRIGENVPVHVFSSADEAELFLNGKSLGKKKKKEFDYRFRWDKVIYEPGQLSVITYKEGVEWARDTIETTGAASQIKLSSDKETYSISEQELAFVTVEIEDNEGRLVSNANEHLSFELSGPASIIATDNGDPYDMVSFSSQERSTLNGKALVIIKFHSKEGKLTLSAKSEGLKPSHLDIILKK